MKKIEVKIGDRFGDLTVVELAEEQILPSGNKINIWKCKCDSCGGYDNISQGSLLKKKRTKCHNCTNPNILQDLIGQTFGRLLVLERAEDEVYIPKEDSISNNGKKKKKSSHTKWKCVCLNDGNIVEVRGDSLKSGRTRSCGCLQKEVASTQGGLSHTSILYTKHRGMLVRCGYRKGATAEQKKIYIDKGIKICDEWLDRKNGFMNFYKWGVSTGFDEEKEKDKPDDEKLTIDRIDSNGNYCPENCRWATALEQANNKGNTIFITYKGETHSIAEWGRIFEGTIPVSRIYTRYSNGLSPEEIFEIPANAYVKKININGKMCTVEQCSYVSGISKFAIYARLSKGYSDYDAVFTPKIGTNKCINGVYFVDDNGYPVPLPINIEEKQFANGVEFITDDNELERYKQELNVKIKEELRRM